MSQQEDALSLLEKKLGPCVHREAEDLSRASFDGLKVGKMPDAVVRPVSGAQVGEILEVASEFSIPVTTRGAGSSLTGGATPIGGGWVLDLSGLDSIEIDETLTNSHKGNKR